MLTELYGPCVIEMSSGQSFGELALIRGEPRGATVITATKSDFMVILKDDYDEVRSPKTKCNTRSTYAKQFPNATK